MAEAFADTSAASGGDPEAARQAADALSAVAGMLWTVVLGASELQEGQIRAIVDEIVPPQQKEKFMSTAEMLKEEGRQEGR